MKKYMMIGCMMLMALAAGASRLAAQDVVSLDPQTLKINLDVKNMSILDVLRLLAEQGQVNIVSSKNVQGRVTAKLQGVTVDEALSAILDTNAFTYKRENGIIKVFTQQDVMQQEQTEQLISKIFSLKDIKANDLRPVLNSIKTPRGRVEINTISNQIVVTDTRAAVDEIARMISSMDRAMETKIYNLSYAVAKDLQAKLVEMIPKTEGEVFIDERTNSLVVRAIPETIEKIDRVIRNWDRRSRQVLIEAKLMQVSADKTRALGINWEYNRIDGDGLNISTTLPLLAATGGVLRVGSLSDDQYQVTIRALESSTDTDVLASPRIVVIDNTEANILVGSSEPYLVTYIDKESGTQTEDTKFIDVGIKLTVTPKISDDKYITLKIHPEVSTSRRVPEVNNALAVDTTQADTVVMAEDGKTIVIGGLIKETEEVVVAKVPILGDIPLLGLAFRSKSKTKTKKELIVFITPHIIKQELSVEQYKQREIAVEDAFQEAIKKWQEE